MNKDVSVILNGFRRPHTFSEQLEVLKKQTIPPAAFFYWQNTVPEVEYNYSNCSQCYSAISNVNFGVWARFAYALNARTNYVCIFDDDTIPGDMWLENCINTFEKTPGLLGTIGIIFKGNGSYDLDHRVGWDNPNEETTQVDIVGHSWFFHRDMLSVFWRELPPMDHNMIVGEDIHFSHMLQKYSTLLKTYVPAHPKDNKRMWGSLKGWEYGNDRVAIGGNGGIPLMYSYMKQATDNGFIVLKDLKNNA